MFSGADFPNSDDIVSINAYLGAFPIAEALDQGGDIVITGRCVDSALILGACIHEFGWKNDEWDKLASGSLAGHILECGPQATGGNHTDWEAISTTLGNIGYPVAEIFSDGSMQITKPENTGGTVTVGTVSEQLLYEIGDPQAYLLPDVVCDFSEVQVEQIGKDCVSLRGAKGRPNTDTYKVCMTYTDGYRGAALRTFYGENSGEKARKYGDAVFARCDIALKLSNLAKFSETSIEVLGLESQYGSFSAQAVSREVVLKIAGKHSERDGIEILLKEVDGMGLATPPGLSSFGAGRSRPSRVVRLFSFLIDKSVVDTKVTINGLASQHYKHYPELLSMKHQSSALKHRPPQKNPMSRLLLPFHGSRGREVGTRVTLRTLLLLLVSHSLFRICGNNCPAKLSARDSTTLWKTTALQRYYCPGNNAINYGYPMFWAAEV
ncbi:MAG: DUF1446 domain-containing protein [Hahellaceae bacterium]|nr:DUF1446 domain-containing protein [Hahellaceae bacterium]